MFTPTAVAHFEASPRQRHALSCTHSVQIPAKRHTGHLHSLSEPEQRAAGVVSRPPQLVQVLELLSATTHRLAAAARGCQRSAARCRDRWGDQSTQNPFVLHVHAAMRFKTSVCATRVPQNREMATLAAQQKMRDYEARLGRLGVQVRAYRGCWEHMTSTWARRDRVCAHACAGSATL